jgi:hypothetical protein
MESDMLYEAFGEHWGVGAVMHGRKPKRPFCSHGVLTT